MTIVAIHQPQYLPWIGYFDKMDQSDVFCLLDTVQYKKNEYQNRNRIKNDQGWQWLTVPVTYRFPQKIRDVAVHSRVPWGRAHIQAMKTHYRKAPYYDRYADRFASLWEKEWRLLADASR